MTYNWDFGDESGTSTDPNPSYQYAQTGEYEVCLDLTLETAGSPSCSGDEFVYPADPQAGNFRNYVVHIKQFPSAGNPNPADLTNLAMTCPEAPFAFKLGQYYENLLPSTTVQEIVNSIITWVGTQGGNSFVATDLGNGYILFQIDFGWAGYDYCDCTSGTSGEGINLYWNWSPGVGTIDFQDNNELSFAENWQCANSSEGDTICLGTEGSGTPAEQCTVQICETVTVPCVQEPKNTMEWVGRLSGFEVVINNTTLNLDPPPLGNPAPQIMEVHANNLQNNTYLSKLHQTMGCCTSLGGTFYVQSTSPDVLTVLNTGVGEWTITLGNDGDGTIVITCADFDTLATGSANFTPVSGAYQWLSQMVVITGSNDLSLLATNQVDITIGFNETCYPGDLKAELHILGNQPNCNVNNDAFWTGSTSNLFFDGLCNQFDNDPVTNDDPNLTPILGNTQVEIDDVDMASNSFSLKMYKPGFECCTNLVTGSTTLSVWSVPDKPVGTTAVINVINATDTEIVFGGTSAGKLTIVAADFASVLEDATTWDDINCEGKYQWLSQSLLFIGSADLDIENGGTVKIRIRLDQYDATCDASSAYLEAEFNING